MKYKVKVNYIVDNNTSFNYDSDCKKFMGLVEDTGVIFKIDDKNNNVNTEKENLSEIKFRLSHLLHEFCKANLSKTAIRLNMSSFTIEVWELHGINLSVDAIIINDYKVNDSVKIYSGTITDIDDLTSN